MNILKFKLLLILVLACSVLNAQKRTYKIKNLTINSKNSDYGVSFLNDSTAVFSSSRGSGLIAKRVWKDNNQPYLDLYKGNVNVEGEITSSKEFSRKINTKYHDADLIFTKDKKTAYFSRNNYLNHKYKKSSSGWNNIKMYRASLLENGDWGEIVELPFNSDEYSVGHPALNDTETILYFSSDMPGTIGDTDIWEVSVLGNNEYGTPKNLGTKINTPLKEMFPYVSANELYFSSQGHASTGNLDIFKSNIIKDGLTIPVNLGKHINSVADDFSFIFRSKGKQPTGYFSSNRTGGVGDDDIYYFKQDKCIRYVQGLVKDDTSLELLKGSTVTLYTADGFSKDVALLGEDASFKFEVDCDIKYRVLGTKEGYEPKDIWFSNFKTISEKQVLLMKKDFIKTTEKVIVNIKPIYFDFDKATIRSDAAIELDKVVAVMQKYPTLIVSSGSHTDARGNDEYNVKLAIKRANATVRYIVDRGISSERISGRGYGESTLQNRCANGVKCSREEHQQNRRTEFVVLNPESIQ